MTLQNPVRRRTAGLGVRLMMLMGAALLPLAVLSYVQTLATERAAESRARAAILGETLIAAAPQIDAIMQAQGVASALAAAIPGVVDDTPACTSAVRAVVQQSAERYSFIGFIPIDGFIACTSADAPFDLSGSPWLESMLADPRTALTVNRNGPISEASVLNISVPVRDLAGALLGFMSISMKHSDLEVSADATTRGQPMPLALMTFDQTGAVLTSTGGMDGVETRLPVSRPLGGFVGQPGQSFIDQTTSGRRSAFAVVPLSPGSLYLMGSWPADRLDFEGFGGALPALTFPLLMWAASLMVAWLAAESQVLRHIRLLRNSITAFAGGDRKLEPLETQGSAQELRDVAEAYEKMTEAILHNEADLENVIHQKEVLLREVHHRVKNNLQLIASILNMQVRTARTTEARNALKSIQERVLSLATIHRELYQTSGLTDIRADELLPQIAHHILRIGTAPGRQFDLDLKIDDIRLTPDQAVPLSLFLTEGMANVMKHAWRGQGGQPRVTLSCLRVEGDEAEFVLRNTLGAETKTFTPSDSMVDDGSDGFGGKLLEAFAQQVEGQMTRSHDGDMYVLSLRFPLRPLTEAEDRLNESPNPLLSG